MRADEEARLSAAAFNRAGLEIIFPVCARRGHFIHFTQSAKQRPEILTCQEVAQSQPSLCTAHRLPAATYSLFPTRKFSPVITVTG